MLAAVQERVGLQTPLSHSRRNGSRFLSLRMRNEPTSRDTFFFPFRLPLLRADERLVFFCLDNDDRGRHGAALSVVGL